MRIIQNIFNSDKSEIPQSFYYLEYFEKPGLVRTIPLWLSRYNEDVYGVGFGYRETVRQEVIFPTESAKKAIFWDTIVLNGNVYQYKLKL